MSAQPVTEKEIELNNLLDRLAIMVSRWRKERNEVADDCAAELELEITDTIHKLNAK
jgi:hypothetical protein